MSENENEGAARKPGIVEAHDHHHGLPISPRFIFEPVAPRWFANVLMCSPCIATIALVTTVERTAWLGFGLLVVAPVLWLSSGYIWQFLD